MKYLAALVGIAFFFFLIWITAKDDDSPDIG